MTRRQLGAKLREARVAACVTQRELADHMGMTTPQFVSNIERGVAFIPPDNVARWAKKIGVAPVLLREDILKVRQAELAAKYGKRSA